MTQFLSTLPAWGATITERCRAYLNKFLSTLPAWGATHAITPLTWVIRYFYPRSPRGERHSNGFNSSGWFGISIHAPRVGSDDTIRKSQIIPIIFLSTLPAWGAT